MRTSRWLVATSMVAAIAAGCSKKGGGGGDTPGETASGGPTDPQGPATTPNGQAADTTVVLAGTLGLSGVSLTDDGLGLTSADAYSIYAVTFEDTPKACKADVDAGTNKFEKACDGFAGAAFGAFVRLGNKTVATIEFSVSDSDSSTITPGAGRMEVKVSYDAKTGLAKAKVDPNSPALKKEAVEAAKAAKGTKPTSIENLTGLYEGKCVARDGFECPPPGGDPSHGPSSELTVYLKTWEHGGKSFMSIWESKEAHDRYFANGGSEASPAFAMDLGSEKVTIDYTDLGKYMASLETVYGKLPSSLKSKVDAKATSTANWLVNDCEREAETAQTFNDANCKLVEAQFETHTYFDFESGQEVTKSYPKFFSAQDFTGLTEYTGAATAKAVPCDHNPETEGAWCPHNVQLDANGVGSINVFVSESGKELRLICQAQGPEGTYLLQDPAGGATKAESLTARAGAKSDKCEAITAGPFAGKLRGLRDESLIHLASIGESNDRGDGPAATLEQRCSRYAIADSFTWSSCSFNDYGKEQPEACFQVGWWLNDGQIGVEVAANGLLVPKGDTAPIWPHMAEFLCPTYYAANGSSWFPQMDGPMAGGPGGAPSHPGCRSEFLAGTAKQQAQRVMSQSQRYMPLKEQILCVDGDQVAKDAVLAIEEKSMLARVRLDRRYDEKLGREFVALECDGPCYENGIFGGRLNGRHVAGSLNLGQQGAFDVSEVEVNSHRGFEDGKQTSCEYVHAFLMQGQRKSDTVITAALSSKESGGCKAVEEEKAGMALQDGPGSGPGSGAGPEAGGKEGGGGGFAMFFEFTRK